MKTWRFLVQDERRLHVAAYVLHGFCSASSFVFIQKHKCNMHEIL